MILKHMKIVLGCYFFQRFGGHSLFRRHNSLYFFSILMFPFSSCIYNYHLGFYSFPLTPHLGSLYMLVFNAVHRSSPSKWTCCPCCYGCCSTRAWHSWCSNRCSLPASTFGWSTFFATVAIFWCFLIYKNLQFLSMISLLLQIYVHRCGRTARASTDGCSIALISPNDASKFASLCKSFSRVIPLLYFVVAGEMMVIIVKVQCLHYKGWWNFDLWILSM